jgi:hypothetical protein
MRSITPRSRVQVVVMPVLGIVGACGIAQHQCGRAEGRRVPPRWPPRLRPEHRIARVARGRRRVCAPVGSEMRARARRRAAEVRPFSVPSASSTTAVVAPAVTLAVPVLR